MALEFSGLEYLSVSTAAVAGYPLTIAGWCYATAGEAIYVGAVGSTDGNDQFSLLVFSSTSGSSPQKVGSPVRVGGTWDFNPSSSDYPLGEWFHAAARFTSSTERDVFINGTSEGTSTTSASPSGIAETRIGQRTGSSGNIGGKLAEVAIWSAALGDDEIAQLAAGFSPLALGHRLEDLVLLQDLIRNTNRPGIGPTMGTTGAPSAAAHPRVLSIGAKPPLADFRSALNPAPHQLAVGEPFVTGNEAAETFVAGAAAGQPI